MNDPRPGDRVRAWPIDMGEPDQTNFDPCVVGIVVGISNARGTLTILVEESGRTPPLIRNCEAETATVLEAVVEPVPDTRPDLVVTMYGNGNAEVRHRGTDTVLAQDATLAALAVHLIGIFPGGFHLDVRYDPHM